MKECSNLPVWNNKHIDVQEILNWIKNTCSDSEKVIGPIEIFRSNDWGVTTKFRILSKQGSEREVVCKVGFLLVFKTSPDIYTLINRVCPDLVPQMLYGELRNDQAWLLFEPFSGESIKDGRLDSLTRVADTMADIQVKVSDYIDKNKPGVSVIDILSIPDLFNTLTEKYIKSWVNDSESISRELNLTLEDYKSIFNNKNLELLKRKIEKLSRKLKEMNIPYSIDHVDLHPGNAVRLDNGRILIYDWEEAVVSCPFFSTDKLLDEAFKLDNQDGSIVDGLWSVSQMAVKEAYISKMKCLTFEERSEAFDVAMCIAPVKYAYQGTFFIEQVGWFESAPVLIGESIVKAHERCSKIPLDL